MHITTPERHSHKNNISITWERLVKRRNSLVKEYGTVRSTWLVIRYLMRKTLWIDWQKVIIFERSLAEPIQEVIPKVPVSIKQSTIDDMGKLASIVDKDKYFRFQQRFKQGKICFIALDKDKVVAFSWISFQNEYIPEWECGIKLNDNEAYVFDSFIDPDYRHKRLHSALIYQKFLYLQKQGYQKAIGYVEINNTYSLKALVSSGHRPKKLLILIEIFGFKFHLFQEIPSNLFTHSKSPEGKNTEVN
jgi:ribosomal protein S18 acetylase RimI-like enzyme